jgi:nitronate monooxygenase
MRPSVFRTRITELFGIRHPVLCGGLQWLADARYVAAVVNAGAMGFITALSFPDDPEAFRREVRRCRELTGGRPFGVSISMSGRAGVDARLHPFVDVIVDEKVRFVETSGGSPHEFVPRLKDAGCTVIHKVPAVRYARSAQKLDVDALSVIGAEAGGHPGVFMIGNMVQGVLAADAVTKPLAIGGGMGTGRHLVTALAMGADAMLLGSRMVLAEEIWAHRAYKEHLLTLDETRSRVVMEIFRHHHRVLDNESARAVALLEREGVTDFERYRPHVAGSVTRRAYETGDWRTGMIDMGPAGVFAQAIQAAEEIIDQIIDEACVAMRRLNTLASATEGEAASPHRSAV